MNLISSDSEYASLADASFSEEKTPDFSSETAERDSGRLKSGVVLNSGVWTFLLFVHVLGFVLSLPPFGMSWLIFLSLGAISLAVLPENLPGRHPYWKLWGAGTVFWVYAVHFVRYPHWINYGLWCLLAGYLGCYLPIFVAVSRTLIFQRIPKLCFWIFGKGVHSSAFRSLTILGSLSIVWAACDIFRGWIFSGMTMASAADVFFRSPILLQTADLWGQWGVSAFFLFLSAAGALSVWGVGFEFQRRMGKNFRAEQTDEQTADETADEAFSSVTLPMLSWSTGVVALCVGSVFLFGYGVWRLRQENPNPPAGNFVLIQGCVPAELETTTELVQKTDSAYLKLLEKVRTGPEKQAIQEQGEKISLVVYPECIYRDPIIFSEKNAFQPKDLVDPDGNPIDSEFFQKWLEQASEQTQEEMQNFTRYVVQAPFLAGCSTFYYRKNGVERHNSAIYVTPETEKIDPAVAYHKMILVPFGEYVPGVRTLNRWFPGIERLTPIMSLDAGQTPSTLSVDVGEDETLQGMVCICFESLLPRFIRRQIAYLRRQGTETDFLISLTNNGWFRRSHEGDFYLASCVLRSIENRKPFLIAANYGISASIDSNGYVQNELPIGTDGTLFARIKKDSRRTFFTEWGGFLLWIPLVVFFCGIPVSRKRRVPNERF